MIKKPAKPRIRKDAYDWQWTVPATDAAVLALLLYVSLLRRTMKPKADCPDMHCPIHKK